MNELTQVVEGSWFLLFYFDELLKRIEARKLIPHACRKVIVLMLKSAGINQFQRK